tara:strand:+ start:362 stop:676 length:315 start_codon:yes stop_codon:yes gene_type:complete
MVNVFFVAKTTITLFLFSNIMQPQGMQQGMPAQGMTSDQDWLVLVLVSFFLGALGVDHFMTGKIGTGVLKLITFGGCGIWALIDFIMILTGNFKDGNGLPVVKK